MKRLFYLLSGVTLLYCFLGGALLVASCSSGFDGGEDEPEKPENPKNVTLELSRNDLVFEAAGGEKTFTISSNGNWTIENGSGWCKTDFNSGTGNLTVTVTADEYSGMEDRNTNLTIKAGDKTQVLGVTQKCKDAIVLSKDKFDVAHAGETISVEVKSNITYDESVPAEFQSWISSAPDTRSVTTTNYNFTIAKNEDRQMRAGYIVFSGNSVRDTIRVYQTDRLILTADTCYVSHAGEEITVELQTNIDYDVRIQSSSASWLSRIETRALRTDKLHFSVSENDNRSAREAVIIVKDKNSDLSDTLCVYQYGRGLVLSERDYTVGMAGDTIAVKVKGGINYDVKIPSDFQSWIVPVGNSSASSRTAAPRMYAFSILKTENTESREGYIVFSGNSLTDTVYIFQGGGFTENISGIKFEMVYVKGGTFRMGATSEQGSDYYSDERPVHEVTLFDYYIGKFEVTQGLWKAVIGNTPSYFKKGDDYPVENITWTDAQTFCTRLSQLTGKKYALPTEAQWEYAARGGNKSKGYKYSGSNDIEDVAWYNENYNTGSTHPVGSKQPNELGIYDMSGNVWEWCSDWYGSNYYSNSPSIEPKGPSSGSGRVLRGGSWNFGARYCRVSDRNYNFPSYRYNRRGFRVVLLP